MTQCYSSYVRTKIVFAISPPLLGTFSTDIPIHSYRHLLKPGTTERTSFFFKQEAVITACTPGFNIFAKFWCRQSKLLQSSSRIFSALHCGQIASYFNHSSWGRRSYIRRNFISSASFKMTKFPPRCICSGTTILRVDSAYRSLV